MGQEEAQGQSGASSWGRHSRSRDSPGTRARLTLISPSNGSAFGPSKSLHLTLRTTKPPDVTYRSHGAEGAWLGKKPPQWAPGPRLARSIEGGGAARSGGDDDAPAQRRRHDWVDSGRGEEVSGAGPGQGEPGTEEGWTVWVTGLGPEQSTRIGHENLTAGGLGAVRGCRRGEGSGRLTGRGLRELGRKSNGSGWNPQLVPVGGGARGLGGQDRCGVETGPLRRS